MWKRKGLFRAPCAYAHITPIKSGVSFTTSQSSRTVPPSQTVTPITWYIFHICTHNQMYLKKTIQSWHIQASKVTEGHFRSLTTKWLNRIIFLQFTLPKFWNSYNMRSQKKRKEKECLKLTLKHGKDYCWQNLAKSVTLRVGTLRFLEELKSSLGHQRYKPLENLMNTIYLNTGIIDAVHTCPIDFSYKQRPSSVWWRSMLILRHQRWNNQNFWIPCKTR